MADEPTQAIECLQLDMPLNSRESGKFFVSSSYAVSSVSYVERGLLEARVLLREISGSVK